MLNSDGSFSYSPNANYNGADSFTYKVNDGSVDSNVATVSITITPVNDAPVAADGSVETGRGLVSVGGHVNASDVDGDPLTYDLVSGPAHGSVVFNSDGSFSYTPDSNYNGADSFTYKANDGTADSNVATVSITVTPVNDAPVAGRWLRRDGRRHRRLVARRVPPTWTAILSPTVLVDGPAHGSLVLNADGSFSYTPDANYNGADSFTYKANDGTDDSNVATVSITVTSVNDAPVAANGSLEMAEDVQAGGQVSASDVDGDSSPTAWSRPGPWFARAESGWVVHLHPGFELQRGR